MPANRINNIAIVGASGHSGSHMTTSLLKLGKNVTAITREDSTSSLPEGVHSKKVNYDDHSTLVGALRGQDALIITLSVTAPRDTQDKLIKAAAEAKVPWVMPNEWSPDTSNPGLARDIPGFGGKGTVRESFAALGISCIAMTTGFWYEWSLSIPLAFAIDTLNKEATLFDEGETKLTVSTWPQVGRAVAALLDLPIKAEDGNDTRSLEHFKNSVVYVGSFTVSQRDMLDSVFRVTGDKAEDWKISNEPAKQRYEEAVEALKQGDRKAYVRQMYTRVFYPDDSGNHEKTKGLSNELLGLPKEDLDEATKVAIRRRKEFTF